MRDNERDNEQNYERNYGRNRDRDDNRMNERMNERMSRRAQEKAQAEETEYNEENKASVQNKNTIIFIFVLTFIIVFIIFFLISNMLPKVDVEIGGAEDEDVLNQKEEVVEKMIDERLKWIQFEDNNIKNSDEKIDNAVETQYSENLEKEYEPAQEAPEVKLKNILSTKQETPQEEVKPKQPVNKVYVGNYSSIEQAMTVQNEIMDENPDITLYIKGLGGSFTLQAGSFTEKERAEALAAKLNGRGIPCRIVKE